MDHKASRPKAAQLTLLLRSVGGAYLLYLAWGLREAAFSGPRPVFLAALVVFVLTGAALLLCSVRLLARGEFLRPGETQDGDGEAPGNGGQS